MATGAWATTPEHRPGHDSLPSATGANDGSEWLGLREAEVIARWALGRCIGEVESFLAEDFAKRPRLLKFASSTAFADLFCLDDVDLLIAGQRIRPPALRLAKHGKAVDPQRYLSSAKIGSHEVRDFPDVGRLVAEIGNGATLVLQGLHRYWPALTQQCDAMSVALSHRGQANAYLTPANSVGLGRHYDTHDVFVLQLAGTKSWTVWEPIINYPLASQSWTEISIDEATEPPTSKTVCEAVLEPGDTLYVPRGFVHSARSLESTSLHLTLGVLAATWSDIARQGVNVASDVSESIRKALPVGFAHDADAREVAIAAHEQLAVGQMVSLDQLIEEAARRFWRGRVVNQTGHLRDLLAVDSIYELTDVYRDPLTVLQLMCSSERATLRTMDREISFPARIVSTVRQLLDGQTWTAASLDSQLDIPSRIVLIKRFVREGIMRISTGTD